MTRSEECKTMLRALLDSVRAHDDPEITIIEDCSPDSARFVLNLAIAALEGVDRYLPITHKQDCCPNSARFVLKRAIEEINKEEGRT